MQLPNSATVKQQKGLEDFPQAFFILMYCNLQIINYFFAASSTATAQATVIPTIGLLPAPIRPIISTYFKTVDE